MAVRVTSIVRGLRTHVRVVRALRRRPFAIYWIGQTVSGIGDGAYYTALAWQVLLLTGSATAMGLVVTAGVIPRLVFLLAGGVAADRLPRRVVLLVSDCARAGVLAVLAGLSGLHLLQVTHVVVLAVLLGVVQGFFSPAARALVPSLVEKDDLPSANALTALTSEFSKLLGPLVGAGCIVLAGPVAAFGFDAATFVISVITLILLAGYVPEAFREHSTRPGRAHAAREERADHLLNTPKKRSSYLEDVGAGLWYVFNLPWLWMGLGVSAVANIGLAGPQVVAMPRLVRDVFGAGPWLLGSMVTANAVGAIAGAFVIGQYAPRRRGLLLYAMFLSIGLAVLALGVPLPRMVEPLLAVCASILIGLSTSVANIVWTTMIQATVPDDRLGRVSSIDMLVSFCFVPVGYVLAGLIADRFGAQWAFALGGAMIVLVAIAALCLSANRQL